MKVIQVKMLFVLCLITFFLSSCVNQEKIKKAILIGYGEYKECLKKCDSLEAKYTAEYDICNKDCPYTPNYEYCDALLTPAQRGACRAAENAKVTACYECNEEYISHMKEVDECRQVCLNEYNKHFEKLEQ